MKIRRVIEVVTTSRTRNAVYRYGIKSSNLLLSANAQKSRIKCGIFVRWRRVRKELFSSRVGSADIRRGAPALRETALSLTLNTQNLSPAFLQGFLVLAESKERTLQFACRLKADIRRGAPALRETALSLTLFHTNLSPA